MKKIVFLSLVALCLPWTLAAQSVVDDLYYVPSKKEKAEQKKDRPKNETVVVTPADEVVVKSNTPMTVHASDGQTTVVVRDAKGNTRDVDEYNRRYEASDYDFTAQNDTLYIDEKPYDGLDGEWVGGEFEGSADDYEYATRIIRFRNPRYAIPISSPLYFDVVYGLNTWDWNVYYDGFYAYAFPTFTNRLWWDWRFNSYGWWGYPYYGWGWSWNSWYDPWYWGARLGDLESAGFCNVDLWIYSGYRPFFLIAGEYDDDASCQALEKAAEGGPAWASDNLGFLNHASGHRPPEYALEAGYEFMEKYLSPGRE